MTLTTRRTALIAATTAIGTLVLSACSTAGESAAPVGAATPATGSGSTSATGKLAAYGLTKEQLTFTVAKSPTCGCCTTWMSYAEPFGLTLNPEHPASLDATFEAAGIPIELQSCHLSTNPEGAMVIGHVPIKHVAEFLSTRTADEIALTVPGMPIGSPGMEAVEFEPYDVIVLSRNGSTRVLAHVAGSADQLI